MENLKKCLLGTTCKMMSVSGSSLQLHNNLNTNNNEEQQCTIIIFKIMFLPSYQDKFTNIMRTY